GRTAVLLIIMALPVLLVHLISGAEQSLNKNVIFSLVFLAPAGALGVEQLATIFAMKSDSKAVRSFFTVAILVIVAVYGLNNLDWLEKQYPDVKPVIEFFEANGHDGMTVMSNGYDAAIYQYSLPDYPNAHYVHISSITDSGRSDSADFILCMDAYYGKQFPCDDYAAYIADDYQLLEVITMPLSWGATDAKIFGRR
ncbi:MAG: hypothetical protein ABIA59_06800, partial [Candidatus Latescibacterota bacterium]